jgi:allophanate hydrolase subunit 1
MYTTMFHEAVEDGLEIVLGMRNLVVLTGVDDAEINRERESLRKWAERAQNKMAEMLKKVSVIPSFARILVYVLLAG